MCVSLLAKVLGVSCSSFREKHSAAAFTSHACACHYPKDLTSPILQANGGKGVAEQGHSEEAIRHQDKLADKSSETRAKD